MFSRSITRWLSTTILGLAGVLGLAACGSSSAGKTTPTAAVVSAPLKFSQCMRAHGVPNFPDPVGGAGGIKLQINAHSGIDPSSPSFKSAQAKCGSLLTGGGPGAAGPGSAQAKARLLQIARCMRQHGISGFPDPTTSQPSGPAGYSLVLGRDGVFLAIPRTVDVQSPAFKQTAALCGFGRP
jgi:hypothetical protein